MKSKTLNSMGISGSKNGGTLVPYVWPYFGGIFSKTYAWNIGQKYMVGSSNFCGLWAAWKAWGFRWYLDQDTTDMNKFGVDRVLLSIQRSNLQCWVLMKKIWGSHLNTFDSWQDFCEEHILLSSMCFNFGTTMRFHFGSTMRFHLRSTMRFHFGSTMH